MSRDRFFLIVCLIAVTVVPCAAQVQWNWSAKKTGDKTYEVHLLATIQRPWHLYSQTTPAGGPVASEVHFGKNPMITFEGATKEMGKLISRREEVFGIDVKYFEENVDFVQTVTLKSNIKTNVQGSVKYMVCDDTQCLPPKTEIFSIPLK